MITIHEGIDASAVKGIHETYGGDVVSKEFIRFLTKLFGGSVIQELQKKYSGDLFSFMHSARHEISRKEDNVEKVFEITLPIKLKEAIESITGKKINDLIQNSPFADQVYLFDDNFTIDWDIVLSFVNIFVQKILKTLEEVLYNQEVAYISTLIGIGEYEESFELPLLMLAVKEKFPHLEVIVPSQAVFSVLRGAISYGFQTHTTASFFNPPDIDQVCAPYFFIYRKRATK